MRRVGTALSLLMLLAAAGCSNSTDSVTTTVFPQPTVVTTTTAVTTSPPTTTTPSSTSTANAPVPETPTDPDPAGAEFDLTGDDLVAVARNWYELYWFLDHNPTGTAADMVDQLYTPTYAQRAEVISGFEELVANDWRYVDSEPRVLGVKILSFAENAAVVWVASERGMADGGLQVIADADGNEVKTYPGWDLVVQEMALVRSDSDSRWLVDATPRYDSTLTRQDLLALGFDWITEDL